MLCKVWTVRGDLRVCVFTKKPVKAGQELTFDYGWEPMARRPLTKCLCNSATCRLFIEDWRAFDHNPAAHRTGTWQVGKHAAAYPDPSTPPSPVLGLLNACRSWLPSTCRPTDLPPHPRVDPSGRAHAHPRGAQRRRRAVGRRQRQRELSHCRAARGAPRARVVGGKEGVARCRRYQL